MGRVWSILVAMEFLSVLAWGGGFGQYLLRYIFCYLWHKRVCYTHVEIHFMCSLAREGVWKNACWYVIWVLACMRFVCHHKLIWILCAGWHGWGLVNVYWDAFNFSLALLGFGQHKFICILCAPWHWKVLVYACWYAICVFACMAFVCQHRLICILCASWHGRDWQRMLR